MIIPRDIAQRMDEIQASKLSEVEVRSRYPDVVAWVNQHVSLVDVMRASGVSLRPISPDAPNILVGNCPGCAGPMLVRR